VWKALGAAAAPEAAAAPAEAAPAEAAAPVEPPPAAPEPVTAGLVLFNLLMAFVGGLILNIMPCVLPVLTLKLYSLVEQGDVTAAQRQKAGLAYTGGILVSFWALALGVFVLRSMFSLDVGWGFQFQYPGYVAALATLVYLFGLSLLGVFELPAIGAERADELGTQEGSAGYFFTGVFATLVATPCSAPFLGTAIAFAFAAPTALLVAVFTAIGLGLAAPFLLVAYVPSAWKVLPRPGAWMESVKHLLGFSLMATTLWLVSVLGAQIGFDHTIGFLVFLLGVSVGAWIYGHFGGVAATAAEQLRALAAGVAVASLTAWRFLVLDVAPPDTCDDGTTVAADLSFAEAIPWQPFHEKRLEALAGKTLFVDFTADWCVSCKVNEHTVLESASVRDAMQRLSIVPLKADWTRKDDVIGGWLKRFGRAGVPMYLVIPPEGVSKAVLLPEVITPDMVIQALETAGHQCPVTPC
jgi:thiol:disulfide interchange protein DsbD